MTERTSWDLISAAQAGDRQAFGELYARYHETVFRYVLVRVRDRHLAEDLAAETFLRALRRLDSVSYQGRDIGAWLVTITRNLLMDHWKRSSTQREVSFGEMPEQVSSEPGPEERVIAARDRAVLAATVAEAMARLPEAQRQCVELRFGQELPHAQVAVAMNRAVSATKTVQHRAVQSLAARLVPKLGEAA